MRISMVTSECEPFAKTGGLADVVDALARALGPLGHEVDVFLPRYRGIDVPAGATRLDLEVPLEASATDPGGHAGPSAAVTVWDAPTRGYRVRLVDHPPSFDRAGIYGDADGDFPDNAARFALLGRSALEAMAGDRSTVDVVHGHDWQVGPLLATMTLDPRHAATPGPARVLTCHNLAFHGWVPPDRAWQLGLPSLDATAGVDLLRTAIEHADLVNTVSPTFARESLDPSHGAGVDDLLRALGDHYGGIMNGIDPDLWDPSSDPVIAERYDAADPAGKTRCRIDLAERHGLDPDGTIMGMVGRLDPQKGFDLVAAAAPALVDRGARLVVLGTGDATLLAELRQVARDRPDRIAVLERFDRDEARRIYAGSDVFLMPSRFEPSGQGQLIALRYGSVPLVRRTGGLADTVRDADADPLEGNGFVFDDATPGALADAARRAIAAHRDAARWAGLVRRGMAEDHGWERPARQYAAMYERAIALRAGARGTAGAPDAARGGR